MKLTAEISMYPLREDFIPPIDAVIAKLNSFADMKVNTFATATTLIGDYDYVMAAIKETLAWSYNEFGTAVFVTKLIPGYDPS
ncbi:MAG: hypothetical protein HN764_14100 [Gammaproteobacteria bacterium]|jgi:uncharacterized protein YqgV (UPF0045/DUF77 family)|nr:hypothetical protein [Gammaproteobacteria bacterium]